MLQEIAKIVSIPFRESDENLMQILRRIEAKLPEKITPKSKGFRALVIAAEEAVNAEGNMSIVGLVRQITAPIPERVYKIKRSPKGARIKIAAANGVRFSFGPIWNDSVAKGKGIAFVPTNRNKLNHQALMAGINSPEKLSVDVLAAKIAETFAS